MNTTGSVDRGIMAVFVDAEALFDEWMSYGERSLVANGTPTIVVRWTCPHCNNKGHVYVKHQGPEECPTCGGKHSFKRPVTLVQLIRLLALYSEEDPEVG